MSSWWLLVTYPSVFAIGWGIGMLARKYNWW